MKEIKVDETDYGAMFENVPKGMRMCGCCMKVKPLSNFYTDGTSALGEVRYRRDCKQCYANRVKIAKEKKRAKRGF